MCAMTLKIMLKTTLLLLVTSFFTILLAGAQATKEEKEEVKLARARNPHANLLKIFKEPDLEKNDGSEEIRFIWMRTFHAPIAIRAFNSKDGVKLRIIRLSGRGGYKFGEIALDKTVSLKKKDWEELKILAKKPNVRKPFKGLNDDQISMLEPLDGSLWSLEVRGTKDYFCAKVSSPVRLAQFIGKEKEYNLDFMFPDLRDFKALGDKLLNLAKSAEPKLYKKEDLY